MSTEKLKCYTWLSSEVVQSILALKLRSYLLLEGRLVPSVKVSDALIVHGRLSWLFGGTKEFLSNTRSRRSANLKPAKQMQPLWGYILGCRPSEDKQSGPLWDDYHWRPPRVLLQTLEERSSESWKRGNHSLVTFIFHASAKLAWLWDWAGGWKHYASTFNKSTVLLNSFQKSCQKTRFIIKI